MPYIIKNTDGVSVAIVEDGSVNDSTSLTFVGKNYSGYGQIQNQNLYHLLENFSSSTAPANPIAGQLWFDNSSENRRLNVCYDGKNFKSIANLINQNTDPSLTMAPSDGDLWWDASNKQIKAWVGNLGSWTVVGPTTGVGAVARLPHMKHSMSNMYKDISPSSNIALTFHNVEPQTHTDIGLSLSRRSIRCMPLCHKSYPWHWLHHDRFPLVSCLPHL